MRIFGKGSVNSNSKQFLAMESVNSLRISAPRDLSVKGETGSVKEKRKVRIFGKGKCKLIANCANFWQGKCKFIANFSAKMVTSLPSLSLSLSLSLYLSLSLTESTSRTI